jgi:hypothetical protein
MFKLREFIELPSQMPYVQRLDAAVARNAICTLLGLQGSGKTWLLDYWRRIRERSPEVIQPRQVVYIHLRHRPEPSFPMTCVVYSRLWHALCRLERPAYLPKQEKRLDVDEEDIKMYNARQLQNLLLKVIERANRLNIRAVIVDNAHYLDKTALEWLLDVRTYYDEQHGFIPRRAIILSGRSDLAEGRRLVENLMAIDEARVAWGRHALEMSYLSRADFIQALAWLTTRNLHAEWQPELVSQREAVNLWELVGGKLVKKEGGEIIEVSGAGWRAVEGLASDLDEELGPWNGKTPRMITRETLDRVRARLGQMKD